ncbi:hypothetical protein LXL04_013227 [Taraxacum kok-saghyz]
MLVEALTPTSTKELKSSFCTSKMAGPLPFHLETGYVGVDVNEDIQLFYYFIQSESNPKEDPVLLWLTGGPGCSSISGLVYQIGPLGFEEVPYNGSLPTLIPKAYSWTKMASIIFLDIPVDTGFSYAKSTRNIHSTDVQYFDHAHEFMRKWFKRNPEFSSNPFYVSGDSYSGIPVPVITQLISDGNEVGTKPYINLKGYILGNPLTFSEEVNYQIRFANGMGLISDEIYKSLSQSCSGEYRLGYINPNNIECVQNVELFQECIDGIKAEDVLEPYCGDTKLRIQLPNQIRSKNALYCQFDRKDLVNYWANDAGVREALGIRKGSIGDWIRCNYEFLNYSVTVRDVRPYHLNLSNEDYRSLIYSGDHDMSVPHQSTQAWIKYLNSTVIDQWRSWKLHGQIAGYTESYLSGMTFATVKASN